MKLEKIRSEMKHFIKFTWCSIVGHKMFFISIYDKDNYKYGCERCGDRWFIDLNEVKRDPVRI